MTTPAIHVRQLWVCLRLHQLALDVIRRALPAKQSTQALAVMAQQRIFMPDTAAMSHGIKPGMSTQAARALLPDLILVERIEHAERQALDALSQYCYRFTPMVALATPDCVLLEIRGSLRLFGGASALLSKISDCTQALGFALHMALGHTPQAARLLSFQPSTSLLQQHTLSTADFIQQLQQLPLSIVFSDEKQLLQLTRVGWRTLGDVLQQNTTTLGQGLGKKLVMQLKKITGDLPDPQIPITPHADFSGGLQLPFALSSVQGLLYPVRRLLDDLQQFLLQRQLTTHGITWQLRDTRKRSHELQIHVAKPQHRTDELLALTRIKLETLKLQDDVDVITLRSERHSALAAQSSQLFRDTSAQMGGDSTLNTVLDRLRARLGDDICVTLHTCDEVLPELATQNTGTEDGASEQHIHDALTQPLWLLSTPQPLRGLNYHGALQLVSSVQRIQSYWWLHGVWRDYYRAQHADGCLYWVFQQFPGGGWFLHGVFG